MQTLTLSGWTQPVDALSDAVPHALTFDYSDHPDVPAAIEALRVFRSVPRVVAWSMGGQLALQAIAQGALAPRQLLLIAPPIQFVSSPEFPHGMSPDTFRQFRANYATEPERTMQRFHGLIAKGDEDTRAVMKQLRHHPFVTDTARWLPWLDTLGQSNLTDLQLPALDDVTVLHGSSDAIVPIAQAEYIRALFPAARYERWEGVGHAPHLADTARFTALLGA